MTGKASDTIVKGSIASAANQKDQAFAEAFLEATAIVLVDTSGSMMETDGNTAGDSRYKVACNQLAKLQAGMPGKIAVVSFSDEVVFCPNGIPQNLNGSTSMHAALSYVLPVDGCGMKIILISDGYPDSEGQTLSIAKKFTDKIDVIYIGPETGSGRAFLHKLAAATGGRDVGTDLNDLPTLHETLVKLLTS